MLCGAILPEHWGRFQVYAERVRIVATHPPMKGNIHPSVWFFLASRCKGSPLVPRLRELEAYGLPISEASPLTVLLSPTLRVLELWFALEDEENRLRSSHIATSLLQTLPLMVPDLEILNYGADLNLGHGYLQSFRHFTRLNTLSMPPDDALNEHMLHILSSITTLRKLSCSIDLSGSSPLALPKGAFQELAELTVKGHSDHLVAFVLACQFPNLVRITLGITQPPSATQPQDVFTAVCQRCDSTVLTSFTADFGHAFASRPSSLMEYFEPLLAFPNITSFCLIFCLTEPSISNDDLARVGAAWPRLASFCVLQLPNQYSRHGVACPTLSGIVELGRRCPRLTTVRIPELDASTIPERGTTPALGHGLRSVSIRNIRVVSLLSLDVYMEVAAVLDRVFPSIDLEDAWSMVDVHGRGKGWDDVLRFMEAMRLGRENGVVYADFL
ncbi:hypothetical protein LXA43DRAFT_365116 [Ganoderma leucocontextum]|nr:hypothetical protein LXA43DRAFT_365116 [Ganoderma leucocontextum]